MTAVSPFDFWNLFVVNVFGGFWPAVIGLVVLYFFIMMMGRISMHSALWIIFMFITIMAMGYGYGAVTIPCVLFILARFMFDLASVAKGRFGL